MASLFRDPVVMTFIDEDAQELARMTNPVLIPRVGENVRLGAVPYTVERVGYDIPTQSFERVWIVCKRA